MKENAGIDSYKGLLILLVVLGHVIGALMPFSSGAALSILDIAFKSIYSFHMAAFFVIAGYLAARYGSENNIPFGKFFLKKSRRLLVPYFVFGSMSAVIYLVTCPEAQTEPLLPFLSLLHGGGWPNGTGFKCNSVLWFLPAMFMTVVVGQILEIFIQKRILFYVLLSACFVPLTGFIVREFGTASWPWAVVVLPRWLAFYFFGRAIAVVLGEKDIINWIKGKINYLSILVIIGLAMVVSYLKVNGLANSIVFSYCLYGVGLVGTVLTAGMSGWMKNRFLSNAGKYSLGIMLFHKFFIVALIRILPSSFTPSLLSVLFMTCCMTLLAMFISYFITLGVLRFCPLLLGGER